MLFAEFFTDAFVCAFVDDKGARANFNIVYRPEFDTRRMLPASAQPDAKMERLTWRAGVSFDGNTCCRAFQS